MSDKDLLCCLPCALSIEILIGWVSLKSIAHLDSAYCSRKRRLQFLLLLRAPGCVISHDVVCKNGQWSPIPWIIRKALKVSELVVSARILAAEHQRCLELVGPTLKSITYLKDLPLELCAEQCHQLNSLTLDDLDVSTGLRDVLLSNPGLQELRIVPGLQVDPGELLDVSCPNLRLVSIRRQLWSSRMIVVDALALKVVSMSASILQLDLQNSRITDGGLLRIAERCPRLRSLGLAYVPVRVDTVLETCTLCPDIVSLDVRSSGTNFSGLAELLPPLQALAVDGMGSVDTFINTHAATLHTLHISQCLLADVARIVAGCPQLHTVAVTTHRAERPDGLSSALAAFTHVTSLCLQTTLSGV